MTNANGHDGHGKSKMKVTSVRDMPQTVEPPRDLWAGIEARINAERQRVGKGAADEGNPAHGAVGSEQYSSPRRRAQLRWLAAAAMIGALAVGVWIGRSVVPNVGRVTPPPIANNQVEPPSAKSGAELVQAAYLSDPKFREQRAELVKSLEARLNALPPDSRAKVVSSLATIHKSMQDLEAALGKDPTNALLQELLLNTYQDEMRVLTTVHEASEAGKGI
jgi:hypothetical protein